jgi:hypothetical protein
VDCFAALESWIARPSAQLRTRRVMTTEYASAIARRNSPDKGTERSSDRFRQNRKWSRP